MTYEQAFEYFQKIEQSEQGTWPDGAWCDDDILKCDICRRSMKTETYMIDGPVVKDNLFSEWANQCVICACKNCPDIGWGQGQLYKKAANGTWDLVSGGPLLAG